MPRGSSSKEVITKKILETFDGSFLYNGGKEIRIPIMEAGELLQVKCSLTCAKTNVESGEDTAMPGENIASAESGSTGGFPDTAMNAPVPPTESEKKRVEELCKLLNL